jgi:hypothetical protein
VVDMIFRTKPSRGRFESRAAVQRKSRTLLPVVKIVLHEHVNKWTNYLQTNTFLYRRSGLFVEHPSVEARNINVVTTVANQLFDVTISSRAHRL